MESPAIRSYRFANAYICPTKKRYHCYQGYFSWSQPLSKIPKRLTSLATKNQELQHQAPRTKNH